MRLAIAVSATIAGGAVVGGLGGVGFAGGGGGGRFAAMAEVRVDVSPAAKSGSLARRTVRWFDRAVLGAVMGAAAWILERAVLRGTRRAEDDREAVLDEKVAPD